MVKKMKVAMLTYEFFPYNVGGLGTAVRHMSYELSKKCDLEVFIPLHMRAEGIKTVTIPIKNAKKWAKKHYKMDLVTKYNEMLPKKFKNHKADVLHAHDWVTAYGGKLIKNEYGIPLVVTVHSSILGKKKYANVFIKEKYELEKSILEADMIIAVSDHIRRELVEIYGMDKRKIRVVYNGVVADDFKTGPEKKFLLFIGRIDPMKGVKYLIEAFSDVQKTFPDYKLMIYGDGLRENVEGAKKQCSELGLEKSVIFGGRVPQKKLIELYSTCTIVCLPSVYEPFGLTVLEGAASGKPVITTTRSGVSEIVDSWKNGVVIKPENSIDLADSIKRLLSDSSLRRKISSNAVKLAKTYTWGKTADDIIRVYSELV
jgi:glycogen(starch) synthase